MIQWKNFLYFPKGDKIAIVFLSVLILVFGSVVLYLNHFSEFNPESIIKSKELQTKFQVFENEQEENLNIGLKNLNFSIPLKEIEKKTARNRITQKNQKLNIGQVIDLNTASTDLLMRIPGIGRTFANRIINYRDSLGGFYSLDQLIEIKGVSIKKYSKILPYIVLEKKYTMLLINRVSEEKLQQHPYLTTKQTQFIISGRKVQLFQSFDDFSTSKEFTPRDLDKLKPYFSFK